MNKQRKLCECGMLIKGISEKHLKDCMKTHKTGRRHKEQMEFKSKENK